MLLVSNQTANNKIAAVISILNTYFQVLVILKDTNEPRSLIKRLEEPTRNITPENCNAYNYFVSRVEEVFGKLDRISQEIIEHELLDKNSFSYLDVYPSSTYYRLKGKAFSAFLTNMGFKSE